MFLLMFSLVRVGDPTSQVSKDLLGFPVPQPPVWTGLVPYVGYFLEAIFAMLSLHGVVVTLIFLSIMGLGMFFRKLGSFMERKSQDGFAPLLIISIVAGIIVIASASAVITSIILKDRRDDVIVTSASQNDTVQATSTTSTSTLETSSTFTAPPAVAEPKAQGFNKLVTENKTKLFEAVKVLSNRKIIEKVKSSVVYVDTTTGSGSGIILDTNGYILTNAHVVSGLDSVTIRLSDGRSFKGWISGRDENIDLALLWITPPADLKGAMLGNSDSLQQGDPVFTFGYPLGIEGDVAFKEGTLSRRLNLDGITYLEMSAQILPGNSGGPLVNESGEVIGVNTQVIGASKIAGTLVGETLKFAIPINTAKNLIPDLRSGRNIVLPKSVATPTPTPQPYPPPPSVTTPPQIIVLPILPPPPPPKPKEPLKVYSISVKDITPTSAKVTCFAPDPLTDTNAEYSTNSDLSSASTAHAYSCSTTYGSAWLENLVPGTTYYYRVKARSTTGLYSTNEFQSDILSFKTLPLPKIINIVVSDVSPNSAKIQWQTDTTYSIKQKISWSTDSGLASPMQTEFCCSGAAGVTATLSPLQSSTTYYYQIEAENILDKGGGKSYSEIMSFTTLAP